MDEILSARHFLKFPIIDKKSDFNETKKLIQNRKQFSHSWKNASGFNLVWAKKRPPSVLIGLKHYKILTMKGMI